MSPSLTGHQDNVGAVDTRGTVGLHEEASLPDSVGARCWILLGIMEAIKQFHHQVAAPVLPRRPGEGRNIAALAEEVKADLEDPENQEGGSNDPGKRPSGCQSEEEDPLTEVDHRTPVRSSAARR
ncbi:UNVERIFIED_CONTAM: hypothetical protein K2H54_033113 [Gekko kuhli]